jgi:alkanesulfonate monooxygenase SsuD/methylene tetrahydromethanopterin reductase-like flavin-dependent oxidoreductase (luciferase family)
VSQVPILIVARHHPDCRATGAADLIAGGCLQLGISRGSPEQVIAGWRYFGYRPVEGETDTDRGRRHAELSPTA